ncbi:MAG: hypothetical protein L3J29_08980 [Cyclobacteriaceae bacterium]|nr:hypothetical protein [Cyclobacteriaceae bacterium]
MNIRQILIKCNSAYLLIIVIFIQSCVAYQTAPSAFNSVIDKGPVKLVDYQGRVYKFKSVGLKDGMYFGTGNVYADLKFTVTPDGAISSLDSAKFDGIYLKDIKKSKRQSVWLGIGLALPVAYLLIGFIVFLSYGL